MKLFWPQVALLALLAGTISSSFAAGPEAARVAIIRYEDKTGTKNFEYMPGSLQDAIKKSMQKKFEFIEVDPAKVEPIAAEMRKKNKGQITANEAAEICRKADIDILIYGNFTLNKNDNEIEIHTDISLGSSDKFRTLPLVENRVDATIFQAADKVGVNIVEEITKVAKEQQQAKGKDQTEKDKKGKTQLAKTEKSKTWADMNWMLTLSMGPSLPLISRDNAAPKVDGMLSFHAARRLKGAWHLGLFGTLGGVRSQNSNSGARADMDVGAAALTGGYFWDISPRWRATSLLGGGYYYGSFNRYTDCQSNCSSSTSEKFIVKNPFALARIGIHFMIFSFLAIGLETDYRLYFDSPKPVQVVVASLAITGMF